MDQHIPEDHVSGLGKVSAAAPAGRVIIDLWICNDQTAIPQSYAAAITSSIIFDCQVWPLGKWISKGCFIGNTASAIIGTVVP